MVYLGPSRGCNSCRRRRKKCDQTRPVCSPSCMKCIRAKRPCSGYEEGEFNAFRQFDPQPANPVIPFTSTARKCRLPTRITIPGTNILPEDAIPPEVTDEQSNSLALRAFFYDFCVISSNRNLSKGFLSGLEMMVHRNGLKSDLAKACLAISFGTHGKPLNRPFFVRKAAIYYQELLGSLANSITNPVTAELQETKLIVLLLGLYQITVATDNDYGSHDIHAKGLAALMKVSYMPLNLLNSARTRPINELQTSGTLSIPGRGEPTSSLNNLLVRLNELWTRHEMCSNLSDYHEIQEEGVALSVAFTQWQTTLPIDFRPTAVESVRAKESCSNVPVGYWPGRLDTYFDLYVAGLWNIFRAARLLLNALIVATSHKIENVVEYGNYIDASNQIFEEVAASIPYHLTENLPEFINGSATNTEITNPGKSLGGLLLMHPLYVVTRIPFLSQTQRSYARSCLEWIGNHMGLGQAALFAKTQDVDRNYLASGCMILWSGFLY